MASQKWPKREWADVKKRLATSLPPYFYPDKTIEMLDHCILIDELKILVPYISLGRLCLSRDMINIHQYTNDCPCMYFQNGHYSVSTYDNLNKWYFDGSEEAVEFVKQNIPLVV